VSTNTAARAYTAGKEIREGNTTVREGSVGPKAHHSSFDDD